MDSEQLIKIVNARGRLSWGLLKILRVSEFEGAFEPFISMVDYIITKP